MRYPLDELLDKKAIVQLKIERIPDSEEDKTRLRKEFDDYAKAIREYINEGACTEEQAIDWARQLYDANGKTWDLEAGIRKGQLGNMSLEEVGKTAIAIRESNGLRIKIKSDIVKTTGIGYRDIKVNHASQDRSKP